MEKIPAACSMDWSIQLEKNLRSRKPGKAIAALEEIGRQLEWWNTDSELTFAEYRMFGLIKGEDKLFLNAIFMRLADAFRVGDKQIKSGVVKLFLRMKRRMRRDGGGIFKKVKLENYLELLSRVKEVFDKGDVEERALALLLFGCWASFGNDCADIRYIVLSSLVSSDVLEVKGALFAAGCLSELSEDFANVFLEMLKTMVLSREISKAVKLAGGRAFAKMWRPFSLADKAHKTGLKLLMDSSEDDFSAVMLISLSRIASRWMLLIPTQIEMLTFFQSDERSVHVQATSLRCHRFILSRGDCNFPSTTGTMDKLFGILYRSQLQPTLHLEALRILNEILLFKLSIIPCMEIPELFIKLSAVVKNILQSSTPSTRLLAVSVLADISGKILGRLDMASGGTGRTLALQVISFVLDQILSLVTPKVDIYQADSAVELEVKRLLDILFNLVDNHLYLQCLMLNNICLFIDRLMKMLNKVMDTEKTDSPKHEIAEFGRHGKPLLSNLMLYVSKIMVSCLLNLEEVDAETSQILDALKLQVENVCKCNYFGSYTGIRYILFLHLLSTFSCIRHTAEELIIPSRNTSLSFVNSILQLDKFTLDYTKKMLEGNSYWYSYKAGKTAACQGAWSTAAFIFKQLITVVQSNSCSSWVKSLAKFSNSEEQIQLFLLSDEGMSIVPSESNLGERGGTSAFRTNYCNYIKNFLRASNTLQDEILAAFDMGHMFSFQRWFLTLRAKVLNTVVDMLKLLDKILFIQDGTWSGGQPEGGILLRHTSLQTLDPLIFSSMEVSCRMMKLAREMDLLSASSMGMDRQSGMSVSALALSCSLMAFTAGFAFPVPNLHSSESYRKFGNSDGPLHALLVEDLVGRVRHIDCETRKYLLLFLKSYPNYKGCFSPRFRNEGSYASHEAIVLHKICTYSVGEIFSLQNEATRLHQDGDAGSQILNRGPLLLLNVISKLMLIPFRTPHHFFRVRPSLSSELFLTNEDGQTVHGLSISPGSHLSLNLCLQLKNMPAGMPGPPKKVYCILDCTVQHSQTSTVIRQCKGQEAQSTKIDDMVELNEKLLRYVVGPTEAHGLHCRAQANDSCSVVNEYVCFELNDRGQGFTSCLLDVSSFPIGSYRIKWHSGFVDIGGSYWSLLNANDGPLFTVREVETV
ncbi:hypothetical protein ABFX02_05G058500 [Erythranthe guttata]